MKLAFNLLFIINLKYCLLNNNIIPHAPISQITPTPSNPTSNPIPNPIPNPTHTFTLTSLSHLITLPSINTNLTHHPTNPNLTPTPTL